LLPEHLSLRLQAEPGAPLVKTGIAAQWTVQPAPDSVPSATHA